MEFVVRRAEVSDAAAACETIRRSIVELCVADHAHDPDILARWLASKTPENVADWFANPQNHCVVAVAAEPFAILGVAIIRRPGEITLNYVSPDVRFSGVSGAMLAALEDIARRHRWPDATLISTTTARRFYRGRGYMEAGPPVNLFGASRSFPMRKMLRDG
ncbi:MAG TPA: GNAT family N-acetyltransferase [Xanthobacteraceae bacterium]|nr:GNAT family N-acetyltransferase [Xanthobacteraceae bacterium]